MIPGELIPAEGEITLNEGREAVTLMVANTGDRPVQVGSHYHFAETNPALDFDRTAAHGMRLDIAAGTAVRFEPGQRREVQVVAIGGARKVFGFNGKVMGALTVAVGLFFAPFHSGLANAQSDEDCISPMYQLLMNQCVWKSFEEAEKAMELTWRSALDHAEKFGQRALMLEAQEAWLTYRDIACEAQASPNLGGSIHPMKVSHCLKVLTAQRTVLLKYFGDN